MESLRNLSYRAEELGIRITKKERGQQGELVEPVGRFFFPAYCLQKWVSMLAKKRRRPTAAVKQNETGFPEPPRSLRNPPLFFAGWGGEFFHGVPLSKAVNVTVNQRQKRINFFHILALALALVCLVLAIWLLHFLRLLSNSPLPPVLGHF